MFFYNKKRCKIDYSNCYKIFVYGQERIAIDCENCKCTYFANDMIALKDIVKTFSKCKK